MSYELINGERYIVDEKTGRKYRDNIPSPSDINQRNNTGFRPASPVYERSGGTFTKRAMVLAVASAIAFLLIVFAACRYNRCHVGPTEQAVADYMSEINNREG